MVVALAAAILLYETLVEFSVILSAYFCCRVVGLDFQQGVNISTERVAFDVADSNKSVLKGTGAQLHAVHVAKVN